MAEGERDLGGVDDSQRLTFKDLMGGEQAEGRLNSGLGKVEDPEAMQNKLHDIDTKAVSGSEPVYDWQTQDPELSDNTAPYNQETGVGGKQDSSSNVISIDKAKKMTNGGDEDTHGPEVA